MCPLSERAGGSDKGGLFNDSAGAIPSGPCLPSRGRSKAPHGGREIRSPERAAPLARDRPTGGNEPYIPPRAGQSAVVLAPSLRYVRSRMLEWRAGQISTWVLGLLLFTVVLRLIKWRVSGVLKSRFGRLPDRLDLLEVAARSAPSGGLWLEFGVFRGESLNFLAQRFREHLYGFDSFEGLPSRWGIEYRAGSFSTAGAAPEVGTNVTLVRGLFSETLPPFLKIHPDGAVSFLHIDSDLYESARVVLETLGPRIGVGTVIVFDEFCGALPDDEARAFREFVRSHRVRFEFLGSSLDAGSVAVRISG